MGRDTAIADVKADLSLEENAFARRLSGFKLGAIQPHRSRESSRLATAWRGCTDGASRSLWRSAFENLAQLMSSRTMEPRTKMPACQHRERDY
jgi:hypothetical protein